jgi:hypothetical protein
MHVLEFCFYGTGVIYSIMYEPKLILIFLTLLGTYNSFIERYL